MSDRARALNQASRTAPTDRRSPGAIRTISAGSSMPTTRATVERRVSGAGDEVQPVELAAVAEARAVPEPAP